MDVKLQQALAVRREVAQVVDKLVAVDKVDENEAAALCDKLDRNTMQDIVEERHLAGVCGYLLCDHKVEKMWKQKLVIRQNRVYDVKTRRYFCSDHCYVAFQHVSDQLPEEPLWMMVTRKPLQIKFLSLSEIRGKPGEEVPLRSTDVRDTLKRLQLLDKVESSEQSSTEGEPKRKLIEEIPSPTATCSQDVELMSIMSGRESRMTVEEEDESDSDVDLDLEDSGETDSLSGFRFKCAGKQPPQMKTNVDVKLRQQMQQLALESIRQKYFVKDAKSRLHIARTPPKLIEAKPNLEGIQLQPAIKEKKILPCGHVLQTFESWITPKTFEVLSHSMREESAFNGKDAKLSKAELMVKRFFQGEMLMEETEAEDTRELVLPLVDSCNQAVQRSNIVLDRLHTVWPLLLPQLSLDFGSIGNYLRVLVESFSLTADNISLLPVEWRVAAICILSLLSKATGVSIGDAIYSDQSKLFISHFLSRTDLSADLIYDSVERIYNLRRSH